MKWRLFPHPNYGNYGGRSNTSKTYSKVPVDLMDFYFKIHDLKLKEANSKFNTYLADSNLFISLYSIKLKDLAQPFYGRVYWIGAVSVFGFIHYFKKPSE